MSEITLDSRLESSVLIAKINPIVPSLNLFGRIIIIRSAPMQKEAAKMVLCNIVDRPFVSNIWLNPNNIGPTSISPQIIGEYHLIDFSEINAKSGPVNLSTILITSSLLASRMLRLRHPIEHRFRSRHMVRPMIRHKVPKPLILELLIQLRCS